MGRLFPALFERNSQNPLKARPGGLSKSDNGHPVEYRKPDFGLESGEVHKCVAAGLVLSTRGEILSRGSEGELKAMGTPCQNDRAGFIHAKDGVGKTTIAVNTAIVRAAAGRDVLLIDGMTSKTAVTFTELRSAQHGQRGTRR
jgi:hypothetical protein